MSTGQHIEQSFVTLVFGAVEILNSEKNDNLYLCSDEAR